MRYLLGSKGGRCVGLPTLPPSFNVHGSVNRNNILVYKSQQDAHVIEFIFVWELLYMFRASLSPIFRTTKQL